MPGVYLHEDRYSTGNFPNLPDGAQGAYAGSVCATSMTAEPLIRLRATHPPRIKALFRILMMKLLSSSGSYN
jgi:hypothetical protein